MWGSPGEQARHEQQSQERNTLMMKRPLAIYGGAVITGTRAGAWSINITITTDVAQAIVSGEPCHRGRVEGLRACANNAASRLAIGK